MRDAVIWERIVEAPGYWAGSDGTIRSDISGKVLKPSLGTKGRAQVNLVINGVARSKQVHVLICAAFHGPKPEGMEVSHIDGNPVNNAVDNLCWETHRENVARRNGHGTQGFGHEHHNSVLGPEDVVLIRTERSAGRTMQSIADELAVSISTVWMVINDRTYV